MITIWKTVRVFISSTFRDMQAERDWLVKRVFPALRQRLEPHRIHLVDIDLRWGITRQQADNDQVLGLCLQQIDECRPFFLGLLGGRYGWVPSRFPVEVGKRYGWTQHHTGKSVTELEILHGVLNDPVMHGRALFCFRSDRFLDAIADEQQRRVYVEGPTDAELRELEPEEAERRAAHRGQQLAELKETIRKQSPPMPLLDGYPCQWNPNLFDPVTKTTGRVNLLKALGDWVIEKLEHAILNAPELQGHIAGVRTETRDELAEERGFHEQFIEDRTRVYVGRQQLQDDLKTFVAGTETKACLVTGPSGSGKSAALAKFVSVWRTQHPQEVVAVHFVGASPRSTSLREMLRHLCAELKDAIKLEHEVKQDVRELSDQFREFLAKVPTDRRVVLVLDAINQLDETDNAHSLYWLPTQIPAPVRLIVSCIDDLDRPDQPALAAMRRRAPHEIKVGLLTDDERLGIVREIPSVAAKTLDEAQVRLLLDNEATRNPLFLLVALEELRGFGSFEELNRKIAGLPRTGDTLTAIFQEVIRRLGEDFNAVTVKEVLTLLACSRRGLSERELLDLLEGGQVRIEDSAGDLFPILRQLRSYLQPRGPLLDFFHRHLAKAAREEFFRTAENLRVATHQRLATFFLDRETLFVREIDEVPWQFAQAGNWESLFKVLQNLVFFRALWEINSFDAREYWSLLESHSPFKMQEAYAPLLQRPREFSEHCRTIAELFSKTGRSKAARSIFEHLMAMARQKGDQRDLIWTTVYFGALLYEMGEYEQAISIYGEAEDACRRLKWQSELGSVLGEAALAHRELGRVNVAMAMLQEQELICRESPGEFNLANCLANQADLHLERGAWSESLRIQQEVEALRQRNGDLHGLADSLGNQAAALIAMDEFVRARELIHTQQSLCRRIDHRRGLANALGNEASLEIEAGNPQAAENLLTQAIRIHEETDDKRGLAMDLFMVGRVFDTEGKSVEALESFERALAIFFEIKAAAGIVQTSWCLCETLGRLGRYHEAASVLERAIPHNLDQKSRFDTGSMRLMQAEMLILDRKPKEALRVFAALHDDLNQLGRAREFGGLWFVKAMKQQKLESMEPAEAKRCFDAAVEVFMEANASGGVLVALLGRAEILLENLNDRINSLADLERVIDISRQSQGNPFLPRALSYIVGHYGMKDELPFALLAAREWVTVTEGSGGVEERARAHLAVCGILIRLDQASDAVAEAEIATNAARASGNPRVLAVALMQLGFCLRSAGAPDEALDPLDEAIRLSRQIQAWDALVRGLVLKSQIMKYDLGRPVEAEQHLHEAMSVAEQHGLKQTVSARFKCSKASNYDLKGNTMSFFDRLRGQKKSGPEVHYAFNTIKRIFKEEGIQLDDEFIAKMCASLPKLQTFECPSGCAPTLFLGEADTLECPRCGRIMKSVQMEFSERHLPKEARDDMAGMGHYYYALKKFRAGDLDGAIASFTKAVRYKPDYVDAYYNRGEARIAKGDCRGAIEDCSKVIQLQPQDADAHLNRGSAKAQIGDFAGSLSDTDTALGLGYAKPIAHFNRGFCLLKLGRSEQARQALENFLAMAPQDSRAQAARAMINLLG